MPNRSSVGPRRQISSLSRALIVLGLALIETDLASATEPLSARQVAEINQAAANVLAKDVLPGLAIAVATTEGVWSAGFGKADLEHEVPVDSHTMFRTASISKWFTASAAMRLAESGKLDLDAPIQQYCSQYPEKEWPITTQLLLSHLSGIRHYHGANGEPRVTEEQRKRLDELRAREQSTQFTRYTNVIEPLNAFKDDPLMHQPGTRFLYSSFGYRVLACVLEGAAQKPYRTLMRELVFAPATMATITEDDALAIVPHRAAGYSRSPDRTMTRAAFRDVSENLPAGGHLATTEELVSFAIAFNSGRLVNLETRNLMMQRPKLIDGKDVPYAPPFFGLGTTAYYGMGLFVGTLNGERVVAHSGSQNGTSTELLLVPEHNIAVAVMTNIDGWPGAHALATKIVDILRE